MTLYNRELEGSRHRGLEGSRHRELQGSRNRERQGSRSVYVFCSRLSLNFFGAWQVSSPIVFSSQRVGIFVTCFRCTVSKTFLRPPVLRRPEGDI